MLGLVSEVRPPINPQQNRRKKAPCGAMGCGRSKRAVSNALMSPSASGPERPFLAASGIFGFLGVGLGAFGAHGLQTALEGAEDAAQRLAWWQTAAQYQLTHAIALGLCAWLVSRRDGRIERGAGIAFGAGIVLFSGSLDLMTLGAPRWLGAVTPIGGLCFLIGWALVTVSALRR